MSWFAEIRRLDDRNYPVESDRDGWTGALGVDSRRRRTRPTSAQVSADDRWTGRQTSSVLDRILLVACLRVLTVRVLYVKSETCGDICRVMPYCSDRQQGGLLQLGSRLSAGSSGSSSGFLHRFSLGRSSLTFVSFRRVATRHRPSS